jgi:hypothetical protein
VSVTTFDLVRHGITARQVRNWTEQGWLQAHDVNPGPGMPLRFPYSESRVAQVMAVLTRAGVAPAVAHTIVRDPAAGAALLRGLADRVGGLS